jgi:hypothetical protein
LLDVCLQHLGFHSKVLALGIQGFFFEVIAVGAIEIADRANGLGHDMEVFGNGRLRVQNEPVVYEWFSLPQKGFLPLPDSPTFQPLSPIFLTFDREKTVVRRFRDPKTQQPRFFQLQIIKYNSDYDQRPSTGHRDRDKQSCF